MMVAICVLLLVRLSLSRRSFQVVVDDLMALTSEQVMFLVTVHLTLLLLRQPVLSSSEGLFLFSVTSSSDSDSGNFSVLLCFLLFVLDFFITAKAFYLYETVIM